MSFDGGSAIGVLHRRRHVRLPEVVRECVHDDECMAVDADGAGRLAVGAAVRVTDLCRSPTRARDLVFGAANDGEKPTPQFLDPSLQRRAMSSRRSELADGEATAQPSTIEQQIEVAVQRTLDLVLGPHMRLLSEPEPAVYTVAQAAFVMQVSYDTILRLVKRGTLPRVPHLDRKVLIPRAAVEGLVGAQPAVWTRLRALAAQ
jgi:excisionase family DNA binding protein